MANEYWDKLNLDGDTRPIADTTARADITNKMDKLNPTGTGAMSINRADNTTVGNYSTAEGYAGTASGTASHAEGSLTQSTGTGSHSEGILTEATGDDSHAEGYATEAAVDHAHAEGLETLAAGLAAHAEGWDTQASDDYSHAEGESSVASGEASHAEGLNCIASGDDSHAEGWSTEASGLHSHAEGVSTVAGGLGSHAEGEGTLASSNLQHVGGKYNTEDTQGDFAEIIGNGTADNARSNARTLDWNGNETIEGDFFFNGGATGLTNQLAGKQDSLTAGNNIQISGSTISATDTKPTNYSADDSWSNEDLASGTSWTKVAEATIGKGLWLVNWAVNFRSAGTSGNTGYRGAGCGLTANAEPLTYIRQQTLACTSNTMTTLSGTAIYNETGSNTKIYLNARHTQGATIKTDARLRVVRIL